MKRFFNFPEVLRVSSRLYISFIPKRDQKLPRHFKITFNEYTEITENPLTLRIKVTRSGSLTRQIIKFKTFENENKQSWKIVQSESRCEKKDNLHL
jgi:hypothetical protein